MGGSLDYSEIQELYNKYPEYKDKLKLFVETGTYKGDTTRIASKIFERVITMEIMKPLYDESIETGKKENCDNISYYLGDSVEILNKVIPDNVVSTMYFIDAHISGMDSGWNRKELVPLMTELDIILTHNKGSNVFILDDARFWVNTQNKPHDWADISIEKILSIFESKGVTVKDHYLKNDRYYVLT